VGDPRLPGAIQIWRMIENTNFMEKVNEVQAHSKPVERLRLTHDNQHLFSVGADGLICMFEVKDRDIRMRQT
jgi:WD40 repeat protein